MILKKSVLQDSTGAGRRFELNVLICYLCLFYLQSASLFIQKFHLLYNLPTLALWITGAQ